MIFPRSALICDITVDIFVCSSWVDLIFPEPHLCLPACVYSSVSGAVWKCPLHVRSAAGRWVRKDMWWWWRGESLYLGQWRHTPLSPCCAPALLTPLPPPSPFFSAPCCDAMQPFCTQRSHHHHRLHRHHGYKQQHRHHFCLFLYYYLLNVKNKKQRLPRNPRQEHFPLPMIPFRFWVSGFNTLHNSESLHKVCGVVLLQMGRHSRVFIVKPITLAAHLIWDGQCG